MILAGVFIQSVDRKLCDEILIYQYKGPEKNLSGPLSGVIGLLSHFFDDVLTTHVLIKGTVEVDHLLIFDFDNVCG